jgi:hypothetical protein
MSIKVKYLDLTKRMLCLKIRSKCHCRSATHPRVEYHKQLLTWVYLDSSEMQHYTDEKNMHLCKAVTIFIHNVETTNLLPTDTTVSIN